MTFQFIESSYTITLTNLYITIYTNVETFYILLIWTYKIKLTFIHERRGMYNIYNQVQDKCYKVESFYKQLSTSTIATNNRLDVRLVLKFVHFVLNFVSF